MSPKTPSSMRRPQHAPHLITKNLKRFENFVDLTKSGLSLGEKFTYRLYRSFSKWSRKWFTHVLLLLAMVLYTVVGALIFRAVEGGPQNENSIEAQKLQKNFFDAMRELSKEQELHHYTTEEFDAKMILTLRKHQTALEALVNIYKSEELLNIEGEPWSFLNAVFYCGTVYTTIGYGNITPKTTLGRSLTIIYAIIGIPLFLILLVDYGKFLTRDFNSLYICLRRLCYTGSCRKTPKQQQMSDGVDAHVEPHSEAATSTNASQAETSTSPYEETLEIHDELHLPISAIIGLLSGYLLITTVITPDEDWTYFETFYFVFISMSTLGFGDLLPKDPYIRLITLLHLFFGLAICCMVINAVQIKLNYKFKQARAKIGANIGMGVADEVDDEMGT